MKLVWILGLALIVFVSAISTGWRLLFHLAWLLVVVTTFSYLWTRLAFRGLRVLRETPEGRVQVGDSLRERLGLRNTSVLPKLWLEVYDGGDLPGRSPGNIVSIGSSSDKRWRRKTVCSRRGRYSLGPLTITASDPFGLFTRTVEAGPRTDLLVYPQVLPLPDFSLPALEMPGGNVAQRRSPNATPTVSSVRDYVAGDSLSSVSWRATARHQKLMVKEFELDPVADVWIVLDLDGRLHSDGGSRDRQVPPDPARPYLNSSVEYAVTIAASVAASMLDKGRSVGLITSSREAGVTAPDRGARQLWKILEVLAVVEAGRTSALQETLLSYQSFFTGNHALLVITPDVSGGWRRALDSAGGRTKPVTAIFIDALTFDSRMPRLLPSRDSSRSRLYSFTVRNGDDVRDALARGTSRQLGAAI
ncbi:MAG: DUF58 domain-containing protein [Chloroflexota bacterium]|nr:DUF58 domain-containing protein [Chloroflexota bacterium]